MSVFIYIIGIICSWERGIDHFVGNKMGRAMTRPQGGVQEWTPSTPDLSYRGLQTEKLSSDLVPERGIEPPTFSLRVNCSTD